MTERKKPVVAKATTRRTTPPRAVKAPSADLQPVLDRLMGVERAVNKLAVSVQKMEGRLIAFLDNQRAQDRKLAEELEKMVLKMTETIGDSPLQMAAALRQALAELIARQTEATKEHTEQVRLFHAKLDRALILFSPQA